MYDYIARREARVFWRIVYDLMRTGKFSEELALAYSDPEGEKRAKYPRPEGFPGCFEEDA